MSDKQNFCINCKNFSFENNQCSLDTQYVDYFNSCDDFKVRDGAKKALDRI